MGNTCIVTKDFDLVIISTKQHKFNQEYAYKKRRYHNDPAYRQKMIDNVIRWRLSKKSPSINIKKNQNQFVLQIDKRIDDKIITVYKLSKTD